jgi:hypothetical protein
MQQHYPARLAFPTYEPSQTADEISIIIMAFFAFIFALTLGIGLIQQTRS